MTKYLSTVLFFVILSVASHSQPWLYETHSLKNNKNATFAEKQKMFEQYWEGKSYEKGKGWKQFKRLEYFAEYRLQNDSNSINSKLYWEEAKKIKTAQLKSGIEYWEMLGPETPPVQINGSKTGGLGRINCIKQHPTQDNILYAGSPSGGFWRSINSGYTWENIATNLLSLGVSDITINPDNPNEIFISSGDGNAFDVYSAGILKSVDGGYSFSQTSLSFVESQEFSTNTLCMSPSNPQKMFVSTSEGIYRTLDGWESNEQVFFSSARSVTIKPDNSNIILASTYSHSGTGSILYSSNGGASFTTGMDLSNWNAQRIEIAYSKSNPNIAYAIACDATNDGFAGFFKSTNGGLTWNEVAQASATKNILGWTRFGNDQGGQGWYDLSITVDPDNSSIIYIGGVNIWKSTDGGRNWTIGSIWDTNRLQRYVHADIHELMFARNGDLFVGSDGGISVSNNRTETWEEISNGLSITQIYDMDIFSGLKTIVIGAQDVGSSYHSNNTWDWVLDGDGMICQINPKNPDEFYVEYYHGHILRTLDGGRSFFTITPDSEMEDGEGKGAWVTPYIIGNEKNLTLYAGYASIYKSTDKGESWTEISPVLSAERKLRVIRQAPSNENVLLVTDGVDLWITQNGGQEWNEIKTLQVTNKITDICFSENDANEMWVSLSGYTSNEKIYYSDNGGIDWVSQSLGLPNVPAITLKMQANSNKLLYCGTDLGVYYKTSQMNAWENINNNLPPVIVNDIELDYDSNFVYIATYGRGVWRSAMIEPGLFLDFTSSSNEICADTSAIVTFTAIQNATFDTIYWEFGDFATPQSASGPGPHKVSYSQTGNYDISIYGIKEGQLYSETKHSFLTAVNDYDVQISASSLFSCGDSISLSVNYDGTIIWEIQDDTIINQTNIKQPITQKTLVKVDVNAGKCQGTDSILINYNADNICNSSTLELGTHGPFSNTCASVEQGEPFPDTLIQGSCNTQNSWCPEGGLHNSVWFRLNVPSTNNLFIEAPGFDNQIALYEANTCDDILSGNFKIIAANDDYQPDYSAFIEPTTVSGDKTYWLQVDGSAGGETGIFHLNIYDSIPLIPKFSASKRTVSIGESINFFDESIGSPTSFFWEFEGGSPSTSTEQNPTNIIYNSSGYYNVKLTITKNDWEISASEPLYVTVEGANLECENITNFDSRPDIMVYHDCGFLAGNNCYNDNAKAEKFTNVGTDKSVKSITCFFGIARGELENMVVFSIWNSTGGSPSNKIATTKIQMKDIIQDVSLGLGTTVEFNDPILVNDDFFVGIELPSNGDTVAILSNADEIQENSAWERLENGKWQPISNTTEGNHSLNISVELCEGAIELADLGIYPNPFTDELYINFKTIDPSDYRYKIYNMQGKLIVIGRFEENITLQSIQLNSITTGNYVLKIYKGAKSHDFTILKIGGKN